ncbi:hypothetical protein L6Q96_00450 [Candidatus Binatia bacterium]|nr:hypothetical protein [Candidatus Binatia bacterium]
MSDERRHPANTRGSALVFALGFMSVVLIIALGIHTLVTTQLRAAGTLRQRATAEYLAEGGVQRATAWFKTQGYSLPSATQLTATVPVNLTSNSKPVTLPGNHPNNYTDTGGLAKSGVVTAYNGSLTGQSVGGGRYSVNAALIATNPETWELLATGTVGKVSRQVGGLLVRQSQPLFQDGLFARDSVQISGNAYTDSYDSKKGAYGPSNRTNDGNMRSNGSMALSGNATIGGNAIPGPSQKVSLSGNAKVTGSTTPAASPAAYAPVTVPGGITNLGALSLSGNKKRTLTAGTYLVSSISITGNAQLIINAAAGPVNLYVTGSISVAGNGIANGSQLPSNLMIYQSGSKGIGFSGNADFYGTVYAPESPLMVSGNGNMFGAFVASTLQNSGNGGIHFDQALKSIPGGPGVVKLTSMWTLPS